MPLCKTVIVAIWPKGQYYVWILLALSDNADGIISVVTSHITGYLVPGHSDIGDIGDTERLIDITTGVTNNSQQHILWGLYHLLVTC